MSALLNDLIEASSKFGIRSATFLGRTVYVRELSYDAAKEAASFMDGRADDDAEVGDVAYILARMLCSEDGEALGEPDDVITMLHKAPASEVFSLWEQVNPSIEEAEKN